MIKIEAKDLQEAYSKAAAELSCSITEIEIDIVQAPNSGFLGMFKKNAIIEARRIGEKPVRNKKPRSVQKEVKSSSEAPLKEEKKSRNNRRRNNKKKDNQEAPVKEEKRVEKPKRERAQKQKTTKPENSKQDENKKQAPRVNKENINKPKVDVNIAVVEIRENINKLFENSCFELETIKVEAFNENTVLIEFSGEDSALLIGKEGYRYKSLSYLLYNWINIKYNLNIRLEIAEFLKNQEEMIEKYLVSVIERVNNNGRAQTKILDGVLVKIALELLRKEFPNKYVGIKSGREGGKFIVINDFNRKNS